MRARTSRSDPSFHRRSPARRREGGHEGGRGGTEDAVFEAGQVFLETFRPDILCEVLPEADGVRLDELLASEGMRRYLVTSTGLEEAERIVPDPAFRDWLFSRRTPDELRARGLPVA
jgi:hypothetical protein